MVCLLRLRSPDPYACQYIPKGTNFENITKQQIVEIENRLNHRPRKTLGWKTPYEVFHEKVAA